MINGIDIQSIRSYPAEAISIIVFKFIQELRVAEATLILFEIYSLHHDKWFEVRNKLLARNAGFVTTGLIITTLFASSQPDPSGFYSLIPGLKILMETQKEPRLPIRQVSGGEEAEKLRKEFWQKFCEENPDRVECKYYEI